MALVVKISNAFKYVKQSYVKVSSNWKAVQNIYVNVNGTWKPLYTYSWKTGSWSECSAECGGGTQTRTVKCQRSHATNKNLDVQAVSDSFCSKAGVTKPNTSQACNTQTCADCRMIYINYTSGKDCPSNDFTQNIWWTTTMNLNRSTGVWSFSVHDREWPGQYFTRYSYIESDLSFTYGGYLYTRGQYHGYCYQAYAQDHGSIRNDVYYLCREAV